MIKTRVNSLFDFRDLEIPVFTDSMPESELQYEVEAEIKNDLLSARMYADAGFAEKGDVAELRLSSDDPRFNKELIKLNLGLGLFSKDLESGILGRKAGETFELKADGSEVTVTVLSLKRRISPELNDDFALSLGIDGVRSKEDYLKYVRDKYMDLFSSAYLEYHAMDIFEEAMSQSDIIYSDDDLKLFTRFAGPEDDDNDEAEGGSFDDEESMFLLNLFLADCANRGIDCAEEAVSLDSESLEALKARVIGPIEEFIKDRCEFVITEDEEI